MEPVSLEEEAPQKRPVFLLVLCILTFVSTGMGIFSPIIQMVRGTRSPESLKPDLDALMNLSEKMRESGMTYLANTYEQLADMTVEINPHAVLAGLIALLIVLLGAFSAVVMLKGRKIGFHLYIGYSFLQLVSVYFFASPENVPMIFPISGGIISLIFIFMYSRNLHWLK